MNFDTVRKRTAGSLLAFALSTGGSLVLAQSTGATPKPSQTAVAGSGVQTSASSAHPHRAKKKKPQAAKAAEPIVLPVPEPPPPPNWPANAQAVPAKVGWNGQKLEIAATNSSLLQIIHDVSSATGVKIEGLSSDQRIFGSYGPADPRDVLAQLLEGSGYNVLMIGDQGAGTPREVVLTSRARKGGSQAGGAQAGDNQQPGGDEDQPEESEQPEQPTPPPPRQPFGGVPPQQPGSGRTPQQLIQELQQRQQQQIQQQQQQPQAPEPQ